MAGKIILYILAALFIIPGLGSLLTGFAIPNNYEQLRNGKIGFGILFLIIGSLLIWAGSKIKVSSSPSSDVPKVPPLHPTAPKTVPVASGDTTFTVIKKNKNQEYVLSHKVYGSPIYMRTDDVYDPGDPCIIDMDVYKIVEKDIQRSSNRVTREKCLLPR